MAVSIFFILDGSGSMAGVQDDVVGGINAFIQDQKDLDDGDTTFSLTVFDDRIQKVYTNEPMTDVEDVTRDITLRGGSTALLDAVGKTLVEAEKENLPGKKLVVIYTDGKENASREWDKPKVKKLFERLDEDVDWTVTFMSADVDNFDEAMEMGVKAGNYANVSVANTGSTFRGMSAATAQYTADSAIKTETFMKDFDVKGKIQKDIDDKTTTS